nr:MAG TPA: hypothetical protein [Caudoviricetes sp.]
MKNRTNRLRSCSSFLCVLSLFQKVRVVVNVAHDFVRVCDLAGVPGAIYREGSKSTPLFVVLHHGQANGQGRFVVNLQNIAFENIPGALVQDAGSLAHSFRVHAAIFAHNVFAGADNTDSLAVNVQVPAGPFAAFQLPAEKNPARQLPSFRLAALFCRQAEKIKAFHLSVLLPGRLVAQRYAADDFKACKLGRLAKNRHQGRNHNKAGGIQPLFLPAHILPGRAGCGVAVMFAVSAHVHAWVLLFIAHSSITALFQRLELAPCNRRPETAVVVGDAERDLRGVGVFCAGVVVAVGVHGQNRVFQGWQGLFDVHPYASGQGFKFFHGHAAEVRRGPVQKAEALMARFWLLIRPVREALVEVDCPSLKNGFFLDHGRAFSQMFR